MINSITNRQIFFIIFLTLTAYTTIDIPKIAIQASGRSSWIQIMTASVIFGLAVVVITKLNNMFQGKIFFDYSREIAGRFFTYVIAVHYLIYFFIINVYLNLKLMGVVRSNFLPKTPEYTILIMCVLLSAYVGYKGITNIARMFEIIGIIFLLITIFICILMLTQGMKYNILPFFDMSEIKHFFITIKNFIIPYEGIETLLIIPFTSINKKASKIAFFTLIFIGILYILIVEGTLSTLGINNTMTLNDSFIEAIKIVKIPVIERLDIFYLTFGLMSLFAGVNISFTAATEITCKLFSNFNRYIIVIAIGIVLFILGLFALFLKGTKEIFEIFAPYFILISDILIPTILFILAKAKKSRLLKNTLIKQKRRIINCPKKLNLF